MEKPSLTETQEITFGKALIDLLTLKPAEEHSDRVETTHGTKTALGLARTVFRLLDETTNP